MAKRKTEEKVSIGAKATKTKTVVNKKTVAKGSGSESKRPTTANKQAAVSKAASRPKASALAKEGTKKAARKPAPSAKPAKPAPPEELPTLVPVPPSGGSNELD